VFVVWKVRPSTNGEGKERWRCTAPRDITDRFIIVSVRGKESGNVEGCEIASTAHRSDPVRQGGVLFSLRDTSLQTLPSSNFGSRFKAIEHANI
jgi:hypothetical protein